MKHNLVELDLSIDLSGIHPECTQSKRSHRGDFDVVELSPYSFEQFPRPDHESDTGQALSTWVLHQSLLFWLEVRFRVYEIGFLCSTWLP